METKVNRPSEDHQHYSIDEMMDRLKQNNRDKEAQNRLKEGELVTRADGTQVIKVRKRKRRSIQPLKDINPNIKWVAIGSFLGLVVTIIVAIVYIVAKYNGSSFKETTQSAITELIEAKSTSISQLRVTPISAGASGVTIHWDDQTFYGSAKFHDIRADIKATSFLSRYWTGEEILAGRGTLNLQTPARAKARNTESVESNYRFGSYRCENLDIVFGDKADAPSLRGIHATLQQLTDGRYTVAFANGTVDIPHWPGLEISSGVVTFNGSNTEIEARLAAGDNSKGELLIKGFAYRDREQPVVLDVKSINYPIENLLGADLGQLIQGNIHSDMGSLSYDQKKDDTQALSFVMPFNSNLMNVSQLPMFNDLRDLTGKSHYLQPSFTHCRGTISRTLDGITLSHLKLVSSQLLSIEGNLSVKHDGSLSGELEIGIPARNFDSKTPAPDIFSASEDGNIYTKINLGGTVHNPHDNLNTLLKSSRTMISNPPALISVPEATENLAPPGKIKTKRESV